MLPSTEEWTKYCACLREYDSILEHTRAVSASLVGLTPESVNLGYAEQIYVKLIAHSVTLRSVGPDPTRKRPDELWDLSSMSAIARCIVEALDALLDISDPSPAPEERDFRLQLWVLHDQTRRARMLDAISSTHEQADEIRKGAAERPKDIVAHPYFPALKPSHRKKILAGDPPAFYLSQKERCVAGRLDHNYMGTATMQLSQFVHTFPFAIHQLFEFRAGHPNALHLMTLPFKYTLPFICVATVEMRHLFPDRTSAPPSRVRARMEPWFTVARHGFSE